MASDPELDHDVLIRRLIETLPCTDCGSMYEAGGIRVIEQDSDTWTLIAFCAACGTESIVKAYVDDSDDPTESYAEELEPPDMFEVEAWHDFLANFNGDLRDLLHR